MGVMIYPCPNLIYVGKKGHMYGRYLNSQSTESKIPILENGSNKRKLIRNNSWLLMQSIQKQSARKRTNALWLSVYV